MKTNLSFAQGASLLALVVGVTGCLDKINRIRETSSTSTTAAVETTAPPPLVVNSVASGSFGMTAAGLASGLVPNGRGLLIRRLDNNSTEAYIHVTGLPAPAPSTTPTMYMAHVHALPCALTDGGGHYKIDPAIAVADETNEVWFMLTPDATGTANGSKVLTGHIARPEAQSMVLHNPADASKVSCLDLLPESRGASITRGDFQPLTTTLVAGVAQMLRSEQTTTVTLYATQLTASTAYPAHVHALPCKLTAGGGHYMMDPAGTPGDMANEVWLPFTTDANGVGQAQAIIRNSARPEAQSVVIHAADGSGTKIACADLSVPFPLPKVTKGAFLLTATGAGRGLKAQGTAVLTREPGATLDASVKGLLAKVSYMGHVHALPCRLGGGGHYKIDPTISAATADNEIWISFTTDSTGSGNVSVHVNAIPRPEAQSVVIHDPADGGRLLCADLE